MTKRNGGVFAAWMTAFLLVVAGPWAFAQAVTPGQPGAKLPEGVNVLRDVEFAKVGGKSLQLDIYTPTEPKGKLPLVVWIFGGAWRGGSRLHGPGFNAIGAVVPHGYVVACISRRFSGEAIFPAQIEDCKAAIRFLRANAAKYSADGDHIGVWGESSGGHLSALLGTSGDVKDLEGQVGDNLGVSSRVQCVVNYCGPSDFTKFAGHPTWVKVDDPKSPICQLVGGLLTDKKELVAKANPITYITKDDPPFLVAHGDKDNAVPFNQSELLVEALKKGGVDVTFEAIKGGGHNFGAAQYERLIPIVLAFFDKHLKGVGAAPQDKGKAAN
ncbi:MAG TPA: alpha/beta hydrolase [Planctomycetota bacterium]|nr:alpha/beta hydrolase [Planctomycetota bacterium]